MYLIKTAREKAPWLPEMAASEAPEIRAPLLNGVVHGSVDHKGRPVSRSNSGGWRSAFFIIGVEIAERCAYYGVSSNLITYLTGTLGQSTATAAVNVNAWLGASLSLPLLGAFVADSFLGRYYTILVASLVYVVGLGLLTLSAVLPSGDSNCPTSNHTGACSENSAQVILFFFSLYLVAFGQGGHKPCVQAFGADQFDAQDPKECISRSSFFNWWYFCMCGGTVVAVLGLNYIQDNVNWGLGFGIPCIMMAIALLVFLLGTRTYRYSIKIEEKSVFQRIGRVFIAAFRNRRILPSPIALEDQTSEQFKFLNKAQLSPNSANEDDKVCSLSEVEEAKAVLRLVPIWFTCLVYAVVFAQSSTFFTKQGLTMDRSISPGFKIPPASLQVFINIAIIIAISIYDRVLVPIARAITGKPSGITMLQRIGTGMLLLVLSMVIAAAVESKRLEIARKHGLIDMPNATVPMSVWWLIPQYVLFGVADVFTMVGLQEFFYSQVPSELRSVGLSLYLSIFGVGNFLSSILVSAIEGTTGGDGRERWFCNNLNRGHLDYFYWLLAVLSSIQLVGYWYFARKYVYSR